MTDDISTFLRRIPTLPDDPTHVERLAGLTNRNYLVRFGDDAYVIRVPGEGTSEYIDRHAEKVAARVTAEAGVNVEVIHFDASDGLMVTRFVEGAITMNAERFKDHDAVARAARAFRRLHRAPELFAVDFRLFEMIEEYKSLLASKGAVLPPGYDEAVAQASRARAALEVRPAPLVPSHCDPLCENFLDTGERMVVIDYEYSGNNDPMWDLGDLSVEGQFNAEQDAALLRAYFGGDPPAHEVGRMVAYKAMCDLLWTLWGVIQHANNNPADDFWAYAVGRFERCRSLMASPDYADHLAAITRD